MKLMKRGLDTNILIYTHLPAFEAHHAATLIRNGVEEVITCNPKDFDIFDKLSTIDPSNSET